MEICIIDDSKAFLKYIKQLLGKIGFENVKLFSTPGNLLKYLKNHKPDVIIIDYILPEINGIDLAKKIKEINSDSILIMLTSSKDINVKNEALKAGFDDFINKDISLPEFSAKMNMLQKLVDYIHKEKEKNEELKKEIEYKNYQEQIAIIKHKKIIKNELSMFFENEHLIESYYKPKDILNGDTIFSKRIKENFYVLGIIDAMGKGLSASLTSINATAFLEHSIKKAIEYKDFQFERTIKDFINYTKSILLENEILCATILCIKENKLYYANFGMPPIYTEKERYKANNLPIRKRTDNFKFNIIPLPDYFFIISDGIIESHLKNMQGPYYTRFIQLYKKAEFIKEIVNDFKKHATQDDDISIIHYKKDEEFEKFFELELEIKDKDSINEALLTLANENLPQKHKIIYILQELFMNTLEHGIYELKNKKEKFQKVEDASPKQKPVKVKITLQKKEPFIKIIYEEHTKGFDINILDEININKYHGRGIKIIKNLSEGIFFNPKGNKLKIFLKDEK